MFRLKPTAYLYFVAHNLVERPVRTIACVLAVAFSTAVAAGALALDSGLVRTALDKVEAAYPPELIVARPKAVSVAMLSLPVRGIDEDALRKIRELDGVASVSPQSSLRVPLRAEIEIAGQTAVTDAVVVGVEPELVEADVAEGYSFRYDPVSTQPIPVIAPNFFLDMYNLAYADSMSLPKINRDFIVGKSFSLVLGETFMFGGPSGSQPTVLTMQVVGFTSSPALMTGLMIPLDHAREINRSYGRGGGGESFTAAHIRLSRLDSADAVTSAIAGMGLMTESNRDKADAFLFVGRSLRYGISAFALVIAVFAAFTVFNSFSVVFNERQSEIGLMRAVGASRGTVATILFGEVFVTGLVGAALGLVLTAPALQWADRLFVSRLPQAGFIPERLFTLNGLTMTACTAAGVSVAILAALPIIIRSVRREPSSLVSES